MSAALLQAVRTAAQKELTARLSMWAGTYVRSLLGLPVMLAHLGLVKIATGEAWPSLNAAFLAYALITALTQIAATAALLSLYRLRSFAVANQLGKSDMIFTAVLGAAFFAQPLAPRAWLALAVTAAGVALIMIGRPGAPDQFAWRDAWRDSSVRIGLFVGVMFGICNLALREAALQLAPAHAVMAGAVTVTTVTAMQALMLAILAAPREPDTYGAIGRTFPLAAFVGLTSALGSIFWFTAFAMTAAANVRIVGQVELIFTVLISAAYFREVLTRIEWLGIILTVVGIVLLQAGR